MQSKFYIVILLGTCLLAGFLKFTDLQVYVQNNMIRLESGRPTSPVLHAIGGLFIQDNSTPSGMQTKTQRRYLILWRDKHFAITHRITKDDRISQAFDSCEYKNCNISYDTSDAIKSDAVIFHGRSVGPKVMVNRTHGQVWIFFENESPAHMNVGGSWKQPPWKSAFNWSMTYDLTKTDIPLPYGELRKRQTMSERNYTAIALQKKYDALIVNSHCGTNSKRETFIKELQKHMSVKVLGSCGEKWKCGQHYVHNDCFEILNEYRYYLAFENSLCRQYFTEKFFDNFKYDTVMVIRAGMKGEATQIFPNGTFISTDQFDSIESLGKYLKNLSVEEYADILKRKDQYFNFGYTSVYKRAMCDICNRMNNQDRYRKTIPDFEKLIFSDPPCRRPDDIK